MQSNKSHTNNFSSIRSMIITALMIALVCLATLVIQIPTLGQGYVNIGDCVIMVSAIVFGPIPGMIAGGVGSALADILGGYAYWAVFTLVIKGLEGLIIGIIYNKYKNKLAMLVSILIGSIIMISGYFLAGGYINGSFVVALSSIIPNGIQAIISMIIAMPFSYFIQKIYTKESNYVKKF
ncbi:MAG: ECF transporter S component [Clostridioides sp.]|nr:ECF transporter S component [Clostridioides sp.]